MEPSDSLHSLTDAAPSVGFGGLYNNEWFADDEVKSIENSKSTAFYELYPIVISCLLCRSQWTRKQITVFCVNAAAEIIKINVHLADIFCPKRLMEIQTYSTFIR